MKYNNINMKHNNITKIEHNFVNRCLLIKILCTQSKKYVYSIQYNESYKLFLKFI